MIKVIKANILDHISIVFFVFLVLVILKLTTPELIPPDPNFYNIAWDHNRYIQMAKDPLNALNGTIAEPYCYRILMPFLAYLLPFGLKINFQIITFFSLFLTGIILYKIFNIFFDKIISFTGIIFFYSFEWGAQLLLYDFWLIDSLAFLFIILCFWAIIKSNYKIYIISLCLGVLTKEIVLFTIPVMLLSEFYKLKTKNPFQKEFLIKCILLSAPGIIAFFLLRIFIVPDPCCKYDYIDQFQLIGIERLVYISRHLSSIVIVTFSALGLIHFIFPLFITKSTFINWIKLYGIFIILIYYQFLIALNTQRLLVVAFFPIILLTLEGMKRWNENTGIDQKYFLIVSISYFIFQIILSTYFGNIYRLKHNYYLIFIVTCIGIPYIFESFKDPQSKKDLFILLN